jgi:hypothetical protein
MLSHCRLCGSSDLRISHFRLKDIPYTLILRYPMRCWVCRGRDHIFIPRVLRMRREAELRNRGASGLDSAQTE